MTKEKAIDTLVNATFSDEWQGNEDLTTAYHMAIKALEQEPIEDCISRQAVLDLINADWEYEGLELDVEDLPPVTPQESRWIPVSERLPEEHKRVIVSDVFGVYIGEFIDTGESWGGKHFINEHGMHSKSVTAWMPLPESYKEESEE